MALIFPFFVAGELPGRKAHCSSTNKKDRTTTETGRERMAVDFAKMPLYFIANEGQVDEHAKILKGTPIPLSGIVPDVVIRLGIATSL